MGARRTLLGVGLAAGATTAAVQVAGRRVAARTDPALEAMLEPPGDATHHHLPTFDGGTLHVVEKGAGPTVVLLHGVTLQWDVWAGVFSELAGDHRVIAWDMRGHGASGCGDDGVSLEAAAADVDTMLRDLDVNHAVVVGHSMGGMVLARFCAEHPAARARRIDHAVFLATSAWPLHPVAVGTAAHHAVVSALTAPLAAGRPYPWNDTAVSRLALRTAFGPRATGRTVDDLRRYMAEMGQRSLLESLQAIAGHSVLDELGDVDLPATVVVGTRDRLTPPRHARALAAALPHARLELLEGTGHQVMQEDPRRLSDLLREIAGA